jgi:putative membrane protein
MFEPQRLHPAAILAFFVHNIYNAGKALLPLLIVFLAGDNHKWLLAAVPFLLALFVVYGLFYWLKFVFYVSAQELRLEYGVFVKKKRYIPFERIQTVQISAGVLQRMFGLVKVEVETAGGGTKAEFVLQALSRPKAEELQQILQTGQKVITTKQQAEATIEYKLSNRMLLLLASTSNGIGVVLSAMLVLASQLDDYFPNLDIWQKMIKYADRLAFDQVSYIILSIIVLLLVAWLLSLLGTIIKFGSFRLLREADSIRISRGLLEKQQLTIPIKRIQAIKVVEGILRQPFGMVSIQVVSISNTGEKGEGNVLFPLLPKEQLDKFMQEVVPEFALPLQVQGLPAKARTRFLWVNIIPALVIAVLCTCFLSRGYISFILVLVGAWLGIQQYKDAGWQLYDNKLLVRSRVLGRTSAILPRPRIQSMDISRNWFQVRKGLTTLSMAVASSGSASSFKLRGIDEQNSDLIVRWFRKQV